MRVRARLELREIKVHPHSHTRHRLIVTGTATAANTTGSFAAAAGLCLGRRRGRVKVGEREEIQWEQIGLSRSVPGVDRSSTRAGTGTGTGTVRWGRRDHAGRRHWREEKGRVGVRGYGVLTSRRW